jgi:PAS domain S-box-containing protein
MNASHLNQTKHHPLPDKRRDRLSGTDALEKIYHTCKSMVGATCGYVSLKNDDGSLNDLLFLDDGGAACAVDPELPMPIRGLRAQAYKLGQAVYENDFMNSKWIKLMPPGHVDLTNVMFAPLNINGETAGLIGLANKPAAFSPQDTAIANAFGEVAAMALEKHQLCQQLIQSEERFELATAERKLQEYTKELETIFNASPNILAIVDQDLNVEMINRQGASLTGQDKADLTGKLCGDAFNCINAINGAGCGQDPECAACPLRTRVVSTFQTGTSHFNEQAKMTCQLNGRPVDMFFSISTNRLSFNNRDRVWLSMTDISNWKKTESALIAKHQEIESIFRSAPAGIGVVSNRVLTKVNRQIEKILGYASEELIGQSARILYPSDKEYEYVGREKYRQIDLYGIGTVETKWRRKDGTILDIWMSSTPLDLSDYSKGVTFSALDITASKENEQLLLESEEKYRTMMEVQKDPTYISSSDMRIQYMNPAMIKWIGKDATGQTCHEAIWKNPSPCSWCQQARIMKGKTATAEVRVPNSDDVFHLSSAPIHHMDGSISKFTSYRNVTDIKQLNMRLQQAQKMETIGTLAGGIAHDFNNILFPILGYTDMLKSDTPEADADTHEKLNQIHTSAMRAKDLVSQILTFARQKETEYKPLQVQLILKEVIKLLHSTIPKSIKIKKYVAPDCRPIIADATQIHQVIMNLTTNAYQAMMDTGGVLSIQLEEITVANDEDVDIKDGCYARLLVADTGIGMPSQMQSKIFDPFFTTKKKDMGTGMGLAMVHGILEKLQGHIKVKSQPGTGTEFQVYFPIDQAFLIDATGASSRPKIHKGTGTILIVDDELAIIRMQTQALEKLGYTIHAQTDPLQALSEFEQTPDKFDLVMTDLSMPVLSGDALAAQLMKIRPDIPILMLTGLRDKFTPEHAEKSGIKGVLMKPAGIEEMSLKIRDVIG